ncbi:MAG: hypothetical protein JHC25_03500 [Thermodesulfobacterium sp.]|nr:hypothetical protein [Thermodesulfobacterium sp.]
MNLEIAKITHMRWQERLRQVLEDFVVFAKRVDKRFLSFIEKEDLYRGLREAKELEREVRGPLKRVYAKWIRKSFEFLRDRDIELELKGVFDENPWFDVLHYLGIQRVYVSPEKLVLGKLYGYVDERLRDFIEEYVSKGYFWSLALDISTFKSFESGNFVYLPEGFVEGSFEGGAKKLLEEDRYYLWHISTTLILRTFYRDFPEKRSVFSEVLSGVLTQVIQGGFSEKHIRVVQTAIAVIKEEPETLPEGEPKSFAEKWLREELEGMVNW